MLLRLVIPSVLLVWLWANGASAQTITPDVDDLFQREAEWLEERTVPPLPGIIVDTEYEDLGLDAFERPPSPPATAGPWQVPIDGLTPPLGLARIDDPAMRGFLDFYATEGLRRASGWRARAGRYRAWLEAELVARGAPPELVWVVAIESAFDPTAVSRAGAAGMWQLMPRTARALGLRVDATVDERFDPERSTDAAIDYLLSLHDRFRSWPVALAAYNAGQGHARSELRAYAVTDFWEMDDYGALYGDARRYALRVITFALIDQDPSRFGLDGVIADAPILWDTVTVAGGVRLSLIAQAAETDLDEIQALNPSLLRLTTPGDDEAYEVRIPVGKRDAFIENYDRLARAHGARHVEVTLRFGETVEDVAGRHGISARLLRAINGLERRDPSPYGATILVPARYAERDAGSERTPTTVITPATRFAYADRLHVFYVVNRQDRFEEVAAHFGVDRFQLAAWNDLDPRAALPEDVILQLWVDPARDWSDTVLWTASEVTALALGSPEWEAWEAARAAAPARQRTHTIRTGDTLIGIAERYGVRVSDLLRWNGLDDAGRIYAGQELRVSR